MSTFSPVRCTHIYGNVNARSFLYPLRVGYIVIIPSYNWKGLANLTSPGLQVTISLWVVVYIFFCFLLCWTLYKLHMVWIIHDIFIVVCYIVHTFSPPFCWKWKVIFNLTYAKSCFACQSYIRLKVYFFKTAVTSDYNSNTLTIWFIIWFNPYARLRCLTNDAIRVERSISLLSFPYKIEKSLY